MKENQIERYQKCFPVKIYESHKKSSTRWFNQKRPDACAKNRSVHGS